MLRVVSQGNPKLSLFTPCLAIQMGEGELLKSWKVTEHGYLILHGSVITLRASLRRKNVRTDSITAIIQNKTKQKNILSFNSRQGGSANEERRQWFIGFILIVIFIHHLWHPQGSGPQEAACLYHSAPSTIGTFFDNHQFRSMYIMAIYLASTYCTTIF